MKAKAAKPKTVHVFEEDRLRLENLLLKQQHLRSEAQRVQEWLSHQAALLAVEENQFAQMWQLKYSYPPARMRQVEGSQWEVLPDASPAPDPQN